jgi:hypothetical protein
MLCCVVPVAASFFGFRTVVYLAPTPCCLPYPHPYSLPPAVGVAPKYQRSCIVTMSHDVSHLHQRALMFCILSADARLWWNETGGLF